MKNINQSSRKNNKNWVPTVFQKKKNKKDYDDEEPSEFFTKETSPRKPQQRWSSNRSKNNKKIKSRLDDYTVTHPSKVVTPLRPRSPARPSRERKSSSKDDYLESYPKEMEFSHKNKNNGEKNKHDDLLSIILERTDDEEIESQEDEINPDCNKRRNNHAARTVNNDDRNDSHNNATGRGRRQNAPPSRDEIDENDFNFDLSSFILCC